MNLKINNLTDARVQSLTNLDIGYLSVLFSDNLREGPDLRFSPGPRSNQVSRQDVLPMDWSGSHGLCGAESCDERGPHVFRELAEDESGCRRVNVVSYFHFDVLGAPAANREVA